MLVIDSAERGNASLPALRDVPGEAGGGTRSVRTCVTTRGVGTRVTRVNPALFAESAPILGYRLTLERCSRASIRACVPFFS